MCTASGKYRSNSSLVGVFGMVWCESGRVVLVLSSASWALQHSLLYGGNADYGSHPGLPSPRWSSPQPYNSYTRTQ